MSVRSTLRIGPALLGLALIVGACSGASGSGPAATDTGSTTGTDGSTVPAATSPEPTFDLGALLSPDPSPDPTPDATPAASPGPTSGPQATPKPGSTAPPVISTTQATNLLSQVDHLLNEIDGELNNADSAANNPGE